MRIDTSAALSSSIHSSPVNWLPWSVLTICGLALHNTSHSARTQNHASSVVVYNSSSRHITDRSSAFVPLGR